jgi:hypothetical protein
VNDERGMGNEERGTSGGGRATDTAIAATIAQFELYRRMTPEQKAQRVSDLTVGACRMALAGLRQRHPGASEQELLLRLAVLRLGPETVARVYGWVAPRDDA